MQAIEVKYKGPTHSKGSRLIVFCATRRKAYSYNEMQDKTKEMGFPSNSDEYTKKAAAYTFANELGWLNNKYELIQGTLKNGNDVFVLIAKGQYV